MITRIGFCLASSVLCGLSCAQAQDVQVNRSNKTIQVTASTTLHVEPEVAQLRFGFKNYAATQQAAIDQNVQAANKITKALLDGGIPKEAIETETISIDRTRDTQYGTGRGNVPEFVAVQEWKVGLPVGEAENGLKLAIRAGANMVQEVEWIVRDPEELSAKANGDAVQKARTLAEQMAKQMGYKLGDLLYISNSEPVRYSRFNRRDGGGEVAYKLVPPPPPPPLPLHLFPAKVEQSATVTAVFAIE
jgi:uncharacterized protein YggE